MSEFKSPQALPALKKDKVGQPPPPDLLSDVIEEIPDKQEPAGGNAGSAAVTMGEGQLLTSEMKSPATMKQEDAAAKKERYDKMMSTIPYREPLGSATADSRYSLEVIKGGSVIQQVSFQVKRFFVVGRIPACDIIAENPTVSRVHAIFQFIDGRKRDEDSSKSEPANEMEGDEEEEKETQVREKGLYLYDLGSTHGTYINKNRLYPNRFYRLRVGHVVKFGNSARLYIVGGPEDDEEEESDKSVSELLKERLDKELERKKMMEQMEEVEVQGRNVEQDGISWGMPEDAEEENEDRENPFAIDFQSSELSLDNPKKSLRSWFEREGYDLEYDVREKAAGHFICRIDLPLDGPQGSKVFAEVEVKGKKKEAVHQAALQACQILDKYGVLRQSHRESRAKRKNRDRADEDYYSSDEDTFLDRTGAIEKKREKRMREAGKVEAKVETYETLLEKDESFKKEIATLQGKIAKAEAAHGEDDEVDPLDAFMSNLKAGGTDLKKLKSKLRELVAEHAKNKKLLHIAKPAIDPIAISSVAINIPVRQKSSSPTHTPESTKPSKEKAEPDGGIPHKKTEIPLFGPRVQFKVSSRNILPSKPVKSIGDTNIPQEFVPDVDDGGEMEDVSTSSIRIEEKEESLKEKDNASPVNFKSGDDDSNVEDMAKEIRVDATVEKSKKITRIRKRPEKSKDKPLDGDYDLEDPNYSVWVPPVGQKGDGRTALNDKLGY